MKTFLELMLDPDPEKYPEEFAAIRRSAEIDRREAQKHIDAGTLPTCQVIRELIDDEPILQSDNVIRYGACTFGCSDSQLIDLHGVSVCKWTRRPCQRITTKEIRKRYRNLNK